MLCQLLPIHNWGGHVKYRVILVIAVSVLASSCTRKAEGQTVAVVNGEEITVPDLNFALNLAKLPEGADRNTARAQALQQLVDRRLLAEQAQKEGIDKSPEYLNRQRRADEDLLISMLAARRLNTAQLPSDREIQTYIASHPEMFATRETWNLDQVQYVTPTDRNIQSQIVGTNSIDQLIAVLTKNKIAYSRQKNRLDTAVVPPELFAKLNSLPAGEPFIVPLGTRSIANAIVGREPRPLTGDDAKPTAVDAIRKTQTAKSLEGLLKSLRSSAKIEYQPGYGPPKKS
jgi:EpsD family peptidyl-prolyl cis-trans isomerase